MRIALPSLECYEIVEEGDDEEIEEVLQVDMSRPLLVEAEWPGMEDKETEHSKTPLIARLFTSLSGISGRGLPDLESTEERTDEEGGENSPKSIRCLAEPVMMEHFTARRPTVQIESHI
ncbi:hypothetical protein Tsubulata_003961 [Turnera subulata]|uniref:Uncharacterized protein n=1 Tax=Turnera subulata TaxID=218843 RepID=A0A9Q0GC75_9ROSI|nr:hypothetical protein Tsubulata_003961 [Turnera subulata]